MDVAIERSKDLWTSDTTWMYQVSWLVLSLLMCVHLLGSSGFWQDVLQKELETVKSAATSSEASKTALEKALEEQKNTSASLEDQLYQQRQLLDEQAEASDALQARLTQVLASEAATQTKLQEAQALEDALTQRLSNSQAAEAVFEELNGDMISKLHLADQRMVALAEELTTSKEPELIHIDSTIFNI